MRIDELHKFSDGTLNDVRNALNDRLKGIRMQYLPSTIWRKGDKDRAAAMIQAIEKMLKTRRIIRSLEKFVGGRLLRSASTSRRFFSCRRQHRFDEAVFVFVFLKDVTGLVNLILLSLFFKVTTTNLSLELLMQGQ
nr:hypothetical protein [Tanacetum cinerariifolium]